MITQAIKHWMSRLFTWWPWRKSSDTSYVQTVGNLNKSVTQEAVWRVTVDGPEPQSSMTSVVIEQGMGETFPEASRIIDEHGEQIAPSSSPSLEEHVSTSQPPSRELTPENTASPVESTTSSPTFEQRLIFLRHLVKRGVINEGFAEGQVPEQYKKP
ncbi:MAG TPA: hypothetical protein VFU49_15985 [Ktedonobacteraceae bacterium]|nr:hypothetical protein [Ktedonobacteraceae bacterium]